MLSLPEEFCSICHNAIVFGKRTAASCTHCFCTACLDEWVVSNRSCSCPTCAGKLIEANALFSMAEYRIDTIGNQRHLIVSFQREADSPNWYYLGNLYSQSLDVSHDVRTIDGKEVVHLKINGYTPRFVVLRQGFTRANSISQRGVSCADVFIDLQTSSLYAIKEDFTTELIGRVGDVGAEAELEVE